MSLSVTSVSPASAPPTAAATSGSGGEAIMAEMLSGDIGVAAELGTLRNDVALIAKLLTTFPKNLGQTVDVGA